MKKLFKIFICSALVFAYLTISCFATFDIDGFLSNKEIDDTQVKVYPCDDNSGNSLRVLSAHYNVSSNEKEIYLNIRADFDGGFEDDNKIALIITVDAKHKIKISKNGEIEYDKKLFSIEHKVTDLHSSINAELKIVYKFPTKKIIPISIQVIDSKGFNSKLFNLEMPIPPETSETDETVDTTKPVKKKAVESTKKSKKEKSTTEKSTDDVYVTTQIKMDLVPSLEEETQKTNNEKSLYISLSFGVLVAIILTLIFTNVKNAIAKAKQKEWEKKHKD